MSSLAHLTLAEALKKLSKKEVSLPEIYADVTAVIKKENPTLNAYLTLNENAEKSPPNKLQNHWLVLPISVKDNFCTEGLRTTASSTTLDNFIPPYDATVVTNLKAAGGVVIGKTNLDAWAHGSSTETSQFGRTLNPRNIDHLPGGSSGGAAATVAADMCIAAIGSETAGSIRQPAAWCGTVGLKPTYGRVSRYGAVAMASSTDSPGPLTKTVEDSAIMLNHLAGHDPYDGTSSSQAVPDFTKALQPSLKGMKIGMIYMDIPGLEHLRPHYEKVAQELKALGAEVEEATAMDPNYAISVYTVIQRGEVSSNLARYDGIRFGRDRNSFGSEAKRRIMLGTYTLAKGYADQYYNLAQKVRTLFMEDFAKLFSKVRRGDLTNVTWLAKKIGATEGSAMFGELEDMLLEASSITGMPGINVPCHHDTATNLFLGLNITAPMWREDLCIKVGYAYEQATSWNTWITHD